MLEAGKCQAIPVEDRTGPEGSRSLLIPDFRVARLSALSTGRLNPPPPPGNIPGTHLC